MYLTMFEGMAVASTFATLIVISVVLGLKIRELNEKIEHLYYKNRTYKNEIKELTRKAIQEEIYGPIRNQEIKDAVHYAMKRSHPDQVGGSQEFYLKFNKLYKSL